MSAPRRPDAFRSLYRSLIGLYPRRFRALYERDLLQAFDDRRDEPRFAGALGGVRLVLFLLRDFVSSVPLAHHGRSSGGGVATLMRDLRLDLRYAGRMLTKNPMFTVAAVTTLALGIGLNAATFTAINGILLRPLDGAEDPDELVQLYRHWPGLEYGSNSIPHYQDVRDRTGAIFENVAAWYFEPVSITVGEVAERTYGVLASANFFQTFGVQPALGRMFVPGVEDRDAGAHPVVVLGHGFWQSAFGADPDAIGRTLRLNGETFEIVGVSAADFKGPIAIAAPPVYIPLMMQPLVDPNGDRTESRGHNSMNVVARLRDGHTAEQAAQAMDAVLGQLREEYPESYDDQVGTTLVSQKDAGIHPSFGPMQMGMGAVIMTVVALLLLIACVNVANLFLARARDRRREMGIRLSIGAGRGRIVRQLLTESLVFSAVGGLAGLALARGAVGMFNGIRPPVDGPWDLAVEVDGTVLTFTVLVSALAGIAFGLVPALHAARPDTAAAVKGAEGPRSSRATDVLVVAQMALSLLLLVSSGLFVRSLQGATEIDPGFEEPRNAVTLAADPGLQGYDDAAVDAFWDRMIEEVAAVPGVQASGLASTLPLSLNNSDRGVDVPGYEFAPDERSSIHYTHVSAGYFDAMGIRLVQGRSFTSAEEGGGAPVLIVNQTFAQRFWPGEPTVGKTVRTAGSERTVVGVVETGKYGSLGESPTEFMYFPYRDGGGTAMTVIARVATDPDVTLGRLRDVIRSMDADLPVYDARSMEDHMGIALLPARIGGTVLGFFGLLGLGLAAVGIYGVMAYSVSQRTRELGIRVAMGADRSAVVGLVLGEGLRLTLLGTLIGVVGALGASRLIAGLLYNVPVLDPFAFGVVPLLLIGVSAVAVYLPARRAAGVDPMRALKTD